MGIRVHRVMTAEGEKTVAEIFLIETESGSKEPKVSADDMSRGENAVIELTARIIGSLPTIAEWVGIIPRALYMIAGVFWLAVWLEMPEGFRVRIKKYADKLFEPFGWIAYGYAMGNDPNSEEDMGN